MTDRFNGLLVTLAEDIREDDAQPLMDAIKHMKWVVAVEGHIREMMPDHFAVIRTKEEILRKIIGIFEEDVRK